MDFQLSPDQLRLQRRCLDLAADFATRSAEHDREATHPHENYDRLRAEGFLSLTIPRDFGGQGASFLDHTIAYEALGQGCPSTALAFNMHASVVMPVLASDEVSLETKCFIADRVVRQGRMIGGNFSEPSTTSLMGERPLSVRLKQAEGGWTVSGRKMFASMIEAADDVLVMTYPDTATSPYAGALVMVPRGTPGRTVHPTWDVLGMRATRSDSLELTDCRVPDSHVIYRSDDMRRFRIDHMNWFWGSYTAVYLGVAVAAYDELRRVVTARQPVGYAQPLSYHPDVRRHVAILSADLESARLSVYRSAWLCDTNGPTPETTASLFRAKYMVGQAVSHITRVALTLGGAHGIFKGSRLEQLFRDGALAPIQPPPEDFCLHNMGIYELGLDPAAVMPPLRAL
jgi:alkylation response protein AidB-like acyl-CoA dehydrogenase